MKDPATFTDFERRYPPDRFGEEASDHARVWKVYRDRATERDESRVEGWNKTLDILLIFAGLFSAVSTAFIIEAYKLLQPDYAEYTVKLLLLSLQNQGSQIPSDTLGSVNPLGFTPTSMARWTNGLWFTSLALSLIVALLSILAKQWLEEYNTRMNLHVANAHRWSWRHAVFGRGLRVWGLGTFISTLPALLHISLFSFFAGLILFLVDLDSFIAFILCSMTAVIVVFYVAVTLLPIWYGDCPTATPLLRKA
ncbi:hypothetical protein BKA62DRAFT_623816, partial [Auriculariales sp. MPI-PUGE-AT-0066]